VLVLVVDGLVATVAGLDAQDGTWSCWWLLTCEYSVNKKQRLATMLGFVLGVIFGALLGYAARAWLSARRRHAAWLERATTGTSSQFVPPERPKSVFDEPTSPSVLRMQPDPSERSQPVDLRARTGSRNGV